MNWQERLQSSLHVGIDGNIGRGTLAALFAYMGAKPAIAQELALAGNVHFRSYGVLDTALRLSHFIAQLAHESDNFNAMEEYASGAAYEGRKDLGNTEPGDGKRFKGRGPIQLTGRANYREYGRELGLDFERHPEIVATPSIGLLAGLKYWDKKALNGLADADNVEAITRKINGGVNGLADRKTKLAKVKGLML